MKVFFINTVCGKGSTGGIVTSLVRLLKNQGHTCYVAYGFGEGSGIEAEEGFKTVSTAGYYLHNALSRLTDHEGLYSTAQTRALVERIREFDPDVIHLHNLHGHYLNYEVLFSYLTQAGKPVVWTLHDCWAFTGHCTHYTAVGCGKWRTGCHHCSQLRQYPACHLLGDVARNYRRKQAAFTTPKNLTLVAPSHWLRQQISQSFLKERPIYVIHNGIDLTRFQPTASDFRRRHGLEDKILLLGVAFNWGHRKGLDVMLSLAKNLDDRYRIVLVGTDETVDKLLPENVLSIHRTHDQEELAQIYTAADLFVNPTREEVLGLVNLEALACGTPVVTFDSGGSPECIDHTCGAVVPEGDTETLLATIEQLCREQPFPPEACIRRAAQFSAQDKFSQYISLYESLASQDSCFNEK